MNARGWMNLVDAEVFLVLFALVVKQDILAGREPELQHILQHHSAKGTPSRFCHRLRSSVRLTNLCFHS
jgi:hypothetical protein